MPSSLDKLASYLGNDKKTMTRRNCKTNDEFKLLIRKGVFPYNYIGNLDKLEDGQIFGFIFKNGCFTFSRYFRKF